MIDNNKLSRALIELRQPNSEADTLEEIVESQNEREQQDKQTARGEGFLLCPSRQRRRPSYVPLSTNLGPKYKEGCHSSQWTLENRPLMD